MGVGMGVGVGVGVGVGSANNCLLPARTCSARSLVWNVMTIVLAVSSCSTVSTPPSFCEPKQIILPHNIFRTLFYVIPTTKTCLYFLTASHSVMCRSTDLECLTVSELNSDIVMHHHMQHHVYNGSSGFHWLLTSENMLQHVTLSKV